MNQTSSQPLIQPLPWTVRLDGDSALVIDANGFAVFSGVTHDEAKFIARACNSHEDLITALTEADVVASAALDVMDRDAWDAFAADMKKRGIADGFGTRIEVALKRAEGKS